MGVTGDLAANVISRARVLRAVEAAKRQLSFHPFVRLEEEFIAEKDGQALHLQLEITREEYEDFARVYETCDVLLAPTSPTVAFPIGARSADPLAMYLSDVYTISANLAGSPALSLPCGFTRSGLPLGPQLQAPAFDEENLLRVARAYEAATDWHRRRPTL